MADIVKQHGHHWADYTAEGLGAESFTELEQNEEELLFSTFTGTDLS